MRDERSNMAEASGRFLAMAAIKHGKGGISAISRNSMEVADTHVKRMGELTRSVVQSYVNSLEPDDRGTLMLLQGRGGDLSPALQARYEQLQRKACGLE